VVVTVRNSPLLLLPPSSWRKNNADEELIRGRETKATPRFYPSFSSQDALLRFATFQGQKGQEVERIDWPPSKQETNLEQRRVNLVTVPGFSPLPCLVSGFHAWVQQETMKYMPTYCRTLFYEWLVVSI